MISTKLSRKSPYFNSFIARVQLNQTIYHFLTLRKAFLVNQLKCEVGKTAQDKKTFSAHLKIDWRYFSSHKGDVLG